ncbi:hypothetical protein TL16_g04013 [Triparma laevis f. inornata]|uniref:FAD-binding domain-containing protein n=1 Tax=Triparma laevis f. inornata TaxID=1714386 RepID=A0A9W7E3C8_9STRA|nr:hypothetical protein TL16_g04013 [Triparma laevis f. inornata]
MPSFTARPTLLLLLLLLLLIVVYATALSPVADVGVIGAGPAGLALAHSLRNEGHTVRIFERRDSFRPVGAAVFLHPFALNSLRKVSPQLEQQLLQVSTQIHTLSFRTLASGSEGFSFALRNLQDAKQVFGAPFVAVRFWDMLKALKSGLSDEGKESCDVRYLVDAGGIRSRTREQLLGKADERIPRLRATFAVVDGDSLETALERERDDERAAATGELAFLAGDNLSVVTMGLDDGGAFWSQTDLGADPFDPIAATNEELQEKLRTGFASFPSGVKALVAATNFEDAIETTVCELPVTWTWGQDDVTLLGDAAHAQLPALGLGVSTAFGDVEEITKQIRRRGLSRDTLRKYESKRKISCAALQLMSRGMYYLNGVSANQN